MRQDGRRASLTAPNGSAQRGLLVAAMAVAGLEASAVGGVEAHGTGTALGDPTEAGSLAAALCGRASGRASPLAVGAAKASIGHSEAASGQAGLQRLATALGWLAAGGAQQAVVWYQGESDSMQPLARPQLLSPRVRNERFRRRNTTRGPNMRQVP